MGRGCPQGLGGSRDGGEWRKAKQKSEACFLSHFSGHWQSFDFCHRRVRFSKDDLPWSQVMVGTSRKLVDLESASRQVVTEEINVKGILKIILLSKKKLWPRHCTGSRSLYVFHMYFICILQGLILKAPSGFLFFFFFSRDPMLLWKPWDIQKSKKSNGKHTRILQRNQRAGVRAPPHPTKHGQSSGN